MTGVALLALLASCGGGGGDGDAPRTPNGGPSGITGNVAVAPGGAALPARNYLPLETGARWIYQEGSAVTTVRVTGQQVVDGQAAFVVQETAGPNTSSFQSLYRPSATGVFEMATASNDPLTQGIGNRELLRYPVRIGESYVQIDKTLSDIDFDADGRSDPISILSMVTVVGLESITTAAGTFADSLHLRTTIIEIVTFSGSAGRRVRFDATGDEWFAPDIGQARRTATVVSEGVTDTSQRDLVGYAVGARKSDMTAPAIQSTTPAGMAIQGPNVVVSAVFSEAMDAQTLSATTFSVVDSGGLAVTGSVQLTGNTARFVPTVPWGNGRYTARVSTGAQDLYANPVSSAATWDFEVDATAPHVVSVVPSQAAQGVGVMDPIVLRFSEPLTASHANTYNFALSAPSQGLPAYVTVSMAGDTVTITPRAPLLRGQDYQLVINRSVADVNGNPLGSEFTLTFRTDPGRFAPPVKVTPNLTPLAMAIGDVNSDGINDLVFTTSTAINTVDPFSLFVQLGRADGSLASPERVATPLGCWPEALVIGDVNGDGRNDVVVGGNGCGAQVFHQTPGGGLTAGEYLNRAGTGRLRLADLNGDGRLDLLSAAGDVWRQDAAGLLVAHPTAGLAGLDARDIEVGDVNGDGRPDVVALVYTGVPGRQIAVRLQQANGSFDTRTYLANGSGLGGNAIAIGDLNGDGRKDLVVTTGGNTPTTIGVYYQSGDGTLGPVTPFASYDIPYAVRVADIDNDGRDDVVVSHDGWSQVGLYRQQADGTLAAEALFGVSSTTVINGMAVGDLNRDGLADIAIVGELLLQRPTSAAPASGRARSAVALRALGASLRASGAKTRPAAAAANAVH